MWILICGPGAVGKTVIADYFKKDDFSVLGSKPKGIGFEAELLTSINRLSIQFKAQCASSTQNVVTIRSFWESMEIFVPIALQRNEIDQHQYDMLQNIYATFKDILKAPSAVFYVKSSQKMSIYNRSLLKQQPIDEETLQLQLSKYESFVEKIRVPLVEIDTSNPLEAVKSEVEFSLASLRSSKLTESTIWDRPFFKY